jgi:uncharacterized protein
MSMQNYCVKISIVFIFMFCDNLCCAQQSQAPRVTSHKKALENERLLKGATIGRLNDVTHALDRGANPNERDAYGMSPLMYAMYVASSGDEEIVKILLSHGANPNARELHGLTPIIIAANHPNRNDVHTKMILGVIKLLLAHGAQINAQDNRGNSALIDAAWWGNTPVVRLLLKNGANIHLRNKRGHTAVEIAQRSYTAIKAAQRKSKDVQKQRQLQSTVSILK